MLWIYILVWLVTETSVSDGAKAIWKNLTQLKKVKGAFIRTTGHFNVLNKRLKDKIKGLKDEVENNRAATSWEGRLYIKGIKSNLILNMFIII